MQHIDISALEAEKSLSGSELISLASETASVDCRELHRFSMGWNIATFILRAHWKRGLLFWMRFAAHPFTTFRWWRYLERFSVERNLPLPHDALLQKPLSKFLMGRISYRKRLDFLMDNFVLASECFAADTMAALWAGKTMEIGTVSGRGDVYRCTLALADLCGGRHEGAFAVRLIRARDDTILWTVKFIFAAQRQGEDWTVVVGGMQGPRAAKHEMVAVTRDLSGLRPKEAVLMVLQGFLPGNAGAYFAIDHARHPIMRRRAKRQKMLLADIDAFWRERCAEPDDLFGFKVPVSALGGADKRSHMKLAFFSLAERFCESRSSDTLGFGRD